MLSLCVVTLVAGGAIFLRISGDIGEMTLDPKLLAEPLNVLARNVVEADAPIRHPEGMEETLPDDGQTGGEPQGQPADVPVPTAEPTQPPSRALTITAVGQVSTGTELRNNALAGGDYSFVSTLQPLGSALAGADVSIATLRTGLTRDNAAFDAYNAPAQLASGLGAAGVNLFNLATDRLFDHGTAGIGQTLDILGSLNLSSAGAYRSAEERQHMQMLDVSGVKVGVLSYTSGISSVGKKAASDAEIAAGTRMLSAQAAANDIAVLRSQGADIVIVLAHWGARGDQKASREVRDMADAMANAGADIILGTGPTLVQEFERRTVTDASGAAREVFIAYSLGNFLIDDSRETGDITGVVLRLGITWDAQSQRATLSQASYMPTWIMRWKDAGGTNRYRVVPAGIGAAPENMTDGIYSNMKKAYDSTVSRLGSQAAQPVAVLP